MMVIHDEHNRPGNAYDFGTVVLNVRLSDSRLHSTNNFLSICVCSICVTRPHLLVLLVTGPRHSQRATPLAWKKRYGYETVYHVQES